ncbi:transglycosylase SLT domain-containing protein [Micropruina sp.]|uniref:aggregation-promoting factor C-terminal-like domain-containing protein n=1 Tax=Micropruina sp. TaxID=2737536 RepID=UPI0039E4F581
MLPLFRPVIGVLAALSIGTVFAPVAQADIRLPGDLPVAPVGDRDSRNSRDDSRPDIVPAVARALDQRASSLSQASVEIAVAERTLRVSAFAEQRDQAEAAARYAEQVKQLGYDPKTSDPRDIAKQIMLNDYEWGKDEFTCVDKIWTQESNWKWNAENPSSGAYGIPQSLPGTKMASIADDWKTNPATQIKWGLKYIKDRYGTPCDAWGFKAGHGWY